MYALVLSVLAFVAAPAPALAAALGHPDYQTRELAQALLARRLADPADAHLDAVLDALRAQLARPVSFEARVRAARLLPRAAARAGDRAVRGIDALTGGQYPAACFHAYDPVRDEVTLPDGWRIEAPPDDAPEQFRRPPLWDWHAQAGMWVVDNFRDHRWTTRVWAAEAVGRGRATPDEVLIEFRRMWHVEAVYYLRHGLVWTRPDPAPYVLALFAWDRPAELRLVHWQVPSDRAFPMPIP